MEKINLVPAFEAIKAKAKNVPELKDLQVPAVVGGEIQMILV